MFHGTGVKGQRRFGGFIVCIVLLAVMLSVSACSASKSSSDSAAAPQSKAMSDSIHVNEAAAPAQNAVASAAASNSSDSMAKELKGTSGSAPVAAGGGFMPMAVTEDGMNRKVIYKAQATMKVPGFESADQQVRDAIHQSGGYILNFSNSVNPSEKGATYVIKVPADGFSSFIEQLRKIEKDTQLQMEGSDVTEEYVDLEARLQAKKAVEARLLAFMDKAKGSDDLVKFSSALASEQEQIEQIKGRMRYLDQNVAFSTVNLRLYEGTAAAEVQEQKPDGLGGRLTAALTGSAKALGDFGEALLVFIAALLPVAAVAAVVGIPLYAAIRRARRSRMPFTTASGGASVPETSEENEGR